MELLKRGETALSLDVIQPKLMQREQRLKLERELGNPEEKQLESVATDYIAKRERYETVIKGSPEEKGYRRGSDTRTCLLKFAVHAHHHAHKLLPITH